MIDQQTEYFPGKRWEDELSIFRNIFKINYHYIFEILRQNKQPPSQVLHINNCNFIERLDVCLGRRYCTADSLLRILQLLKWAVSVFNQNQNEIYLWELLRHTDIKSAIMFTQSKTSTNHYDQFLNGNIFVEKRILRNLKE